MSKVYCKVVRPSTGSELTVEIPEDIVREMNTTQNATTACEWGMIYKGIHWIGEEFDWQFIPLEFYEGKDNE